MNMTFKYLTGSTAALLVFAAFTAANAAPTQAAVNQARAECHAQKEQVKARGPFARDEERNAWEASCGHANALMDEFSGGSAEFAAFEGKSTTPAAQPEPVSSPAPTPPAAMPASE